MTNPLMGIDSSRGGDGHEAHSVEGSVTLPPGDYDFQVRFHIGNQSGSMTCTVPSWHFTVERIV